MSHFGNGVVKDWFYTGGGECLRWWMSGVVNVWGGERLGWWTSGVVNVWVVNVLQSIWRSLFLWGAYFLILNASNSSYQKMDTLQDKKCIKMIIKNRTGPKVGMFLFQFGGASFCGFAAAKKFGNKQICLHTSPHFPRYRRSQQHQNRLGLKK